MAKVCASVCVLCACVDVAFQQFRRGAALDSWQWVSRAHDSSDYRTPALGLSAL